MTEKQEGKKNGRPGKKGGSEYGEGNHLQMCPLGTL